MAEKKKVIDSLDLQKINLLKIVEESYNETIGSLAIPKYDKLSNNERNLYILVVANAITLMFEDLGANVSFNFISSKVNTDEKLSF